MVWQIRPIQRKYYSKVSPIRGIELNLKHLLGRPPRNQAEVSKYIALIAEQGFDALVDSVTHSGNTLKFLEQTLFPTSEHGIQKLVLIARHLST